MKVNENFKSSIFSLIFSNPDTLRELYCALEGITISNDVPVIINTLEDILFMDMNNDISFEIGGKLVVLIEHQSTINPNMALRLLMYIGRVYEKIIADKKIYSSAKVLIPQPEFFVLYNGVKPFPDEKTIKLSELFENTEELGFPKKKFPALELGVRVININEGKNEGIAKRCRTLAQYSALISKVRDYQKEGLSLKGAIKKAVPYCRKHDILKEFIEEHAKEIMSMLTTEWNWDVAKEIWQEEAREEGLSQGREEGIGVGLAQGREEGIGMGLVQGREEIARNALAKGIPIETIKEITGLSLDTIERLT